MNARAGDWLNARAKDWLCECNGLAMQGQGTGYMNVKVWLRKGKGRDQLRECEGLAT